MLSFDTHYICKGFEQFSTSFSLLCSERKTECNITKMVKNGVNVNSMMSIFSVNSDESLNGLQKVYAWYQSNRNTLHTKPVRKCYLTSTFTYCRVE